MAKSINPVKEFRPRRWSGPLNERYQDFQVLTHGRQGDLYIARDKLNDGALVAIKFLVQSPSEKLVDCCGVVKNNGKKGHDKLFRILFEGEIIIHTSLALKGVPNIPMVAEYIGEEDEIPIWDGSEIKLPDGLPPFHPRWPYFAVQCIEGVELARLMYDIEKRYIILEDYLSPREWGITVAGIMFGLLEALEGVHAYGIIHRDIQPRNIIVGFDGISRLLDFGISYLGEENPSIGGFHEYKAPERIRGEAIYPQSDLYSLGCLGYLLLSLYNPEVEIQRRKALGLEEVIHFDPDIQPRKLEDSSEESFVFNALSQIRDLIHRDNRCLAFVFDRWLNPDYRGRGSATDGKNLLALYLRTSDKYVPEAAFIEMLDFEYRGRFGLEETGDISEDDLLSLSKLSLSILE